MKGDTATRYQESEFALEISDKESSSTEAISEKENIRGGKAPTPEPHPRHTSVLDIILQIVAASQAARPRSLCRTSGDLSLLLGKSSLAKTDVFWSSKRKSTDNLVLPKTRKSQLMWPTTKVRLLN